jgi:hypothetical protein
MCWSQTLQRLESKKLITDGHTSLPFRRPSCYECTLFRIVLAPAAQGISTNSPWGRQWRRVKGGDGTEPSTKRLHDDRGFVSLCKLIITGG